MAKLPDQLSLGPRPTPDPQAGISTLPRPNAASYEAGGAAAIGVGRHMEQASDILFEYQRQADNLRAEDAYNTLREKQLELTVGENGFINRKGGDAVNAPVFQDYNRLLNDQIAQISSQLENPQQKEFFRRRANVAQLQFSEQILRHVTQERAAYAEQVFGGTLATEQQNIASQYLDPNAVALSITRMEAAADTLAREKGIDPTKLKAEIRDKAQEARFDAWMYVDPMKAREAFKEVAADPKAMSPAMRLKLDAKLKQTAVPLEVKNDAAIIMGPNVEDDVRKSALPSAGNFDTAVDLLLKKEGGYVAKDGKSGAPANFGINQRANPDVDVKNLTKPQAVEIYRNRYWNAIGADTMAPNTAIVALDTAALQGPEVARQLVISTGGDPQKMIDERRRQLTALAESDPEQKKNLKSWMSRLDTLQREVSTPNTPSETRGSLAQWIAKAEQVAQERHPNDPVYRDALVTEIKSKYNTILVSQQGQVKDAHAVLMKAGLVPPGQQGPTTLAELVNSPATAAAWNIVSKDPDAMRGVYAMLEHNSRPAQSTAASRKITMESISRMDLPDGDPLKISDITQLTKLFAAGLVRTDYDWLRRELEARQSIGGKSFAQDVNTVRRAAHSMITRSILGSVQPDIAEEAAYRFSVDLDQRIDQYRKEGKDPRTLLVPGSKDYALEPGRVMSFLTPSQAAVSEEADKLKQQGGGTEKVFDLNPSNPAATYDALPNGAKYRHPDGSIRIKRETKEQRTQRVERAIQNAPVPELDEQGRMK